MEAKKQKMTAEEFDRVFDEGDEAIDELVDWDNATRKVNVDFPVWMIEELDREAIRLSIPRQALIKMWIDQRLTEERDAGSSYEKAMAIKAMMKASKQSPKYRPAAKKVAVKKTQSKTRTTKAARKSVRR